MEARASKVHATATALIPFCYQNDSACVNKYEFVWAEAMAPYMALSEYKGLSHLMNDRLQATPLTTVLERLWKYSLIVVLMLVSASVAYIYFIVHSITGLYIIAGILLASSVLIPALTACACGAASDRRDRHRAAAAVGNEEYNLGQISNPTIRFCCITSRPASTQHSVADEFNTIHFEDHIGVATSLYSTLVQVTTETPFKIRSELGWPFLFMMVHFAIKTDPLQNESLSLRQGLLPV